MFSVLDAAAAAKGENVLAVWFRGGFMDAYGWQMGGWVAVYRGVMPGGGVRSPPCTAGRVENYPVPCALMLTSLFHVAGTVFLAVCPYVLGSLFFSPIFFGRNF